MSGNSITPLKLYAMNAQIGDSESWDTNAGYDAVICERENGRHPANNSTDVDDNADHGGDGDIHEFSDVNAESFSRFVHIPECQDKVMKIHDRITRIVDRMSCITKSLKQVHQGLRKYSNYSMKSSSMQTNELKKAAGDVGSTQTDPVIKPQLNMVAERVGDSVACQTIEDNQLDC